MKNEINTGINNTWECYLCDKSSSFESSAKGFLANYHPLCEKCADKVMFEIGNENKFRLTYHYEVGDIIH